ncbi:adenylate/guanylate cyclase domain-containing protein [Salinisphaera sp. SPP-AMP-43]|uniref:adenylate/guanylate cyclase domain-containing protein n=1 Tax=Salinisphaera sp. SPP-AMP-43 TaxID=3121288 RepID=UPI003C6E5E10
MAGQDKLLEPIREIVDKAASNYGEHAEIESCSKIPDPGDIPQRKNKWLRLDDVISVFVDMKGSTKLSSKKHPKSTAEIYQYFTDTVVRICNHLGAAYLDIKGDGIFALFDKNTPHAALCAAVTCKTFANDYFSPQVTKRRDVDVGVHIGIDCGPIVFKRIGLEPRRGADDSGKRNEVWAGKCVNMSSKLAALGDDNELKISSRFFDRLTHRKALKSCGCDSSNGAATNLWEPKDVTDDFFDFKRVYTLRSNWCDTHGKEYCDELLKSENEELKEALSRDGTGLLSFLDWDD